MSSLTLSGFLVSLQKVAEEYLFRDFSNQNIPSIPRGAKNKLQSRAGLRVEKESHTFRHFRASGTRQTSRRFAGDRANRRYVTARDAAREERAQTQ